MDWQHIIDEEQSINAIMKSPGVPLSAESGAYSCMQKLKVIRKLRFSAYFLRFSWLVRKILIILVVLCLMAACGILFLRINSNRMSDTSSIPLADDGEESEMVTSQETSIIDEESETTVADLSNNAEADSNPTDIFSSEADGEEGKNSSVEDELSEKQGGVIDSASDGRLDYVKDALLPYRLEITDNAGSQGPYGEDTVNLLYDGRYDTFWSVPISSIVGQPLILYWAEPKKGDSHTFYDITGVVVVPGNNTDEESFNRMGRPTEMVVHTLSAAGDITLDLSDYSYSDNESEKSIEFVFDRPFKMNLSESIAITITGFEPGDANEELCISEMYFCGTPREKY